MSGKLSTGPLFSSNATDGVLQQRSVFLDKVGQLFTPEGPALAEEALRERQARAAFEEEAPREQTAQEEREERRRETVAAETRRKTCLLNSPISPLRGIEAKRVATTPPETTLSLTAPPNPHPRRRGSSQEVANSLFSPSPDEFHIVILKGVGTISGTL